MFTIEHVEIIIENETNMDLMLKRLKLDVLTIVIYLAFFRAEYIVPLSQCQKVKKNPNFSNDFPNSAA